MTSITISRFLTATAKAKPEGEFTASVWEADPDSYDAEKLLDTIAENQRDSGRSDYFSFSLWDDAHTMEAHCGTTALTLEYDLAHVDDVRAALADLPFAYYEIPTKADRTNCVLFAFPLKEQLGHNDTTRAASLIAQMIEVGGLMPNSYLYSYFFRFRDGEPIPFSDGRLFDQEFIEEAKAERIITNIKAFVR